MIEVDSPTPTPGNEKLFMPALSPPPKNLMTVVETVYHQVFGEQPVSIESRFERELASEEQMYQRRKVATEDWQSLDLGWVSDAGTVVIQNTENKLLQVIPTPEQKAEIAKKIIAVSYNPESNQEFYILSGESIRLHPSHADKLMVRCLSGNAKYTINAIPS
jgi:hypothetical protein